MKYIVKAGAALVGITLFSACGLVGAAKNMKKDLAGQVSGVQSEITATQETVTAAMAEQAAQTDAVKQELLQQIANLQKIIADGQLELGNANFGDLGAFFANLQNQVNTLNFAELPEDLKKEIEKLTAITDWVKAHEDELKQAAANGLGVDISEIDDIIDDIDDVAGEIGETDPEDWDTVADLAAQLLATINAQFDLNTFEEFRACALPLMSDVEVNLDGVKDTVETYDFADAAVFEEIEGQVAIIKEVVESQNFADARSLFNAVKDDVTAFDPEGIVQTVEQTLLSINGLVGGMDVAAFCANVTSKWEGVKEAYANGGTPSPAPTQYGDITKDGKVDVTDVQCVLLINTAVLAGYQLPSCATAGNVAAADVNCDGLVNVLDTQLVIHLSLGNAFSPIIDANADGIVDACQAL